MLLSRRAVGIPQLRTRLQSSTPRTAMVFVRLLGFYILVTCKAKSGQVGVDSNGGYMVWVMQAKDDDPENKLKPGRKIYRNEATLCLCPEY